MTQRLDPMVVLLARINARALLWQRGQFDLLADLMQPLYEYAIKENVFAECGGVEGIDLMMLNAMTALAQPGESDG